MSAMVHLAVAGDITEAEELQEMLSAAGIESELQSALDEPLVVALTEPDEIVGD
jgi:hypothetical protein